MVVKQGISSFKVTTYNSSHMYMPNSKKSKGFTEDNELRLSDLQALGGKRRTQDEEREYKRLMERRRQSKSVLGEKKGIDLERLEVLRKIGGIERTKEEEKEYKKLMERNRQKLLRGKNEQRNRDELPSKFEVLGMEASQIKKSIRREKNRMYMANKRKQETLEETVSRQEKDREIKYKRRQKET